MGSSRSTRMVIATVCSLVLVLIQLGFCTEVDYNTGTAGWENAPEASAYSSDSSNINYLPQERNQYGQGVLTPISKDLSGSSTLGTLFSEDEDPIYAAEHFPKRQYRRRRRKNKLKKKKRPVLEYYDDYDSEYYDRDDVLHGYFASKDDGYSAPKAPSSGYSAPSSGYEAPSSEYGAPSYESAPSYNAPSYGGDDDGFNDFLNALAAFLPIGLFLAAIPPNLITISTKKKRSLTEGYGDQAELSNHVDTTTTTEYHYPFLERISEIGFSKMMSDVECQKRVFCEMSLKGMKDEDANTVQKAFNYFVLLMPKSFRKFYGTTDIFLNMKEGNCSVFQC